MIPEIDKFLDDLSKELGIKRLAICLVVDHLGYSVKYHDVRYHMKSMDVKEAANGLREMDKIMAKIRSKRYLTDLSDANLFGGGYGD